MDVEARVVARFADGKVKKGYLSSDFRIDEDSFTLYDSASSDGNVQIAFADLKALFFVKPFEGEASHVERKAFGIRKQPGRKVFIKFKDNETLMGYIEGAIPWDKGFSLKKLEETARGFYIVPVDTACNNDRVFVIGSAIQDVTIMMI